MKWEDMKYSKYWTILGGVVAFTGFSYVRDFIPTYTYISDPELLGLWSMILLGVLFGGAISLSTNRRPAWDLMLTGAIGFWLANQLVYIFAESSRPITISYIWFNLLFSTAVGAIGGMILGYRLDNWQGMVFLGVIGVLSVGLGEALSLNLLDYTGRHIELQAFYAPLKTGVLSFVFRALLGSLIWGIAWRFYHSERLMCPLESAN
jgi:hypothetical protein